MKIRLAMNTGAGSWSTNSNGTGYGAWYAYAHKEEIKTLYDNGVRAVRMGGIHQRFLDQPGAAVFNPRVAEAVEAVRYARGLGMDVYQQMHEYGYGWGAPLTQATAVESARCFEPFAEFKGDPGFLPCSWNEPKAFSAAAYFPLVDTWLKSMRARGWTQPIGISAANWAGIGQIPEQMTSILALNDRNIFVEGHYYHDTGSNPWPNWSGRGVSADIWGITEAEIDSGAFKAKCDRYFEMSFGAAFKSVRANGLPILTGETSLPLGKVGNAVRRYLQPKWEANADVLRDRILWCAAQHMDPSDANALFYEADGVKVDGTRGKVPVPNALFEDELAARAEYEGEGQPTPEPVNPPLVVTSPVSSPPPVEPAPVTPAPAPAPTATTNPQAKAQTYVGLVAGTNRVKVEGAHWNGGPVAKRRYELRIGTALIASEESEASLVEIEVPAEHHGKPLRARVHAFTADGKTGWVDSWNTILVPVQAAPEPTPVEPTPEPTPVEEPAPTPTGPTQAEHDALKAQLAALAKELDQAEAALELAQADDQADDAEIASLQAVVDCVRQAVAGRS